MANIATSMEDLECGCKVVRHPTGVNVSLQLCEDQLKADQDRRAILGDPARMIEARWIDVQRSWIETQAHFGTSQSAIDAFLRIFTGGPTPPLPACTQDGDH